jgi:hypothetical protein
VTAWLVLVGARHIDTVFFKNDMDGAAVRRSLIQHDMFPNNIHVVRRK